MSTIRVESATDQKSAVVATIGDLARNESVEDSQKSAPAPKSIGENAEDSETSRNSDVEDDAQDTRDSDDESENDESATRDSDDKPQKTKGGFKRRINKLSAKLSAKEQELEYWKSQALTRKETEDPKIPVQVKSADKSDKPKAEIFDSHEEFVEALTDWKIEQREKAREIKTKEETLKSEFQTARQKHVDRVNEFAKTHDDFQELMEEVDDIPMSLAVQEVILSSDNGPDLMYALAKNRDEYERICALPPIQAARELGRFESKIRKSSETSQEIKTTKAPPPIAPLKSAGSGNSRKNIYDPNLSQAEYERLRREQIRKNA